MDPDFASKPLPFYHDVVCRKLRGGKKALWQASKPGCKYTGAGNTADNAIKDLQKQIKRASNQLSPIIG